MFSKIKKSYIFIYFLCAIGAPAVFLVPVSQNVASRSGTFVMIWMGMYVLTLCLLVFQKNFLDKKSMAIFALPAIFIFSAMWSLSTFSSLQYAMSYMFNVLAAFLVVHTIPVEKFPRYLGRFLFFACVLSYLLFVVGFDAVKYTDVHHRPTLLGTAPLRGLFNHKITAGIGGCAGFILMYHTERGWFRIFALLFLLFFILSAGSSLALSALIVAMVASPVLNAIRRTRTMGVNMAVFLLALCGCGIAVFHVFGAPILELLGRDVTLTGRTLLWGWGMSVFTEKPILGWGYHGYNGSESAALVARSFHEFFYYDVPHFHNSFIQILVEVGIVGFSIMIALLISTFQFWSALSRTRKDAKAVLSLLFFLLFSCFFMNQLHIYNNLNSMVITIAALYGLKNRGKVALRAAARPKSRYGRATGAVAGQA